MSEYKWFEMFQLIFYVHILCVYVIKSERTTVYADINWKGDHQDLDTSVCTNFAKELVKSVSSIKTYSQCVRLYAEENCSGKYIDLLSYAIHKSNLNHWSFDNMAVSAGPCGDPCDVEVTGPPPSKSGLNVTVYDRPYYRGGRAKLNVNGCTLIPRKLASTIKTTDATSIAGHCVELYNNVDCKTEGKTWTGDFRSSIEFRQGSPSLDNLKYWLKETPIVSAISHCSLKCHSNKNDGPVTKQEPTKENPVVFFDWVNVTGNALPVCFSGFNQCVSLDQFDNWEGRVFSVKVFEKRPTCVVLYDDLDCTGDWEFALFNPDPELGTEKYCRTNGKNLFCPTPRSVLLCDPKNNKFRKIIFDD